MAIDNKSVAKAQELKQRADDFKAQLGSALEKVVRPDQSKDQAPKS